MSRFWRGISGPLRIICSWSSCPSMCSMSLSMMPCCPSFLVGPSFLRVRWFFIAPAFSQCIEGLGPHLWVRGLANRAAMHVPRVALSLMCRFESDLVSLVYSVEVDFGSQLAKGSTICEFGLLGLSFVEGKQAAKSSEGKFLLRFCYNYPLR